LLVGACYRQAEPRIYLLVTKLEPFKCKRCGAATSQYEPMDIRYVQRQYVHDNLFNETWNAGEKLISQDDVPVFLCQKCLQAYVNDKNRNSFFTRRGQIPLILFFAAVAGLLGATLLNLLDVRIARWVMVAAFAAVAVFVFIRAPGEAGGKSRAVTKSEIIEEASNKTVEVGKMWLVALVLLGIGVGLIFVSVDWVKYAASLLLAFAVVGLGQSIYEAIRGHRDSPLKPDDFKKAVKYYFAEDDDIELLDKRW